MSAEETVTVPAAAFSPSKVKWGAGWSSRVSPTAAASTTTAATQATAIRLLLYTFSFLRILFISCYKPRFSLPSSHFIPDFWRFY